MGQLIITLSTTVDGAFEAPTPEPDGWLVMDPEGLKSSLEMWRAADGMLLGRRTYEGLAGVWPGMAELPGLEAYAHRMNSMRKYVASTTLDGPLEWNAALIDGDVIEGVRTLKAELRGALVIPGAGELARTLILNDLVDEIRFTVSPYLWPQGPRVLAELPALRLDLVASSTFSSGVAELRYRPRRDPARHERRELAS